jgi:hypothetical protein
MRRSMSGGGYFGRTGDFTLSIVENRNLECSSGGTTG